MALKSKEWFDKECRTLEQGNGPLATLARETADKSIGQSDGTRGHIKQAVGVSQNFLMDYPQHAATIRGAAATEPFDISNHPAIKADLIAWISSKSGSYGRVDFGYNYDTFKNNVTPTLGGSRTGGGGGNDEFKRVIRIVAEYY